MAFKKVMIADLVPLPYNPRVIGKDEMERLKASIQRHSEMVPGSKGVLRLVSTVTINKNGNRIVGGNQRARALAELGQDFLHEDDVTWVDVEPDSVKEKALSVALNSGSLAGDWDKEKLDGLLTSINEVDESLLNEFGLDALADEIGIDLGDAVDGFEARSSATVSEDGPPMPKSTPTPPVDDEYHPEDTPPVRDKFKGEPGTQMTSTAPVPPSPGEGDDSAPVLFPLSYAVTAEQRKTVLEAIAKAREKFKVETSAEALTAICAEFSK